MQRSHCKGMASLQFRLPYFKRQAASRTWLLKVRAWSQMSHIRQDTQACFPSTNGISACSHTQRHEFYTSTCMGLPSLQGQASSRLSLTAKLTT